MLPVLTGIEVVYVSRMFHPINMTCATVEVLFIALQIERVYSIFILGSSLQGL